MMSLSISNPRMTISQKNGPVDVTAYEVELFKKVNGNNTERISRFVNNFVKGDDLYDNYSDNDETVLSVMFLKQQQIKKIDRILRNFNTVIKIPQAVDSVKYGIFSTLSELIETNSRDISYHLLNYFAPDFNVAEIVEEKATDEMDSNLTATKLVISDRKPTNLSSLFRTFGLSESLSMDLQEVYVKGVSSLDMSKLYNLCTGFFSFFISMKIEKKQNDDLRDKISELPILSGGKFQESDSDDDE